MTLARKTTLRRRRATRPGTRDQREEFKRRVCQGAVCAVADDGRCDGDLQAHHVVPQELILRRAETLQLDRHATARLLWDPRNGLAVCRRHHDRHTLARRRIPLRAVTRKARQFARELALEHTLQRYYRREET